MGQIVWPMEWNDCFISFVNDIKSLTWAVVRLIHRLLIKRWSHHGRRQSFIGGHGLINRLLRLISAIDWPMCFIRNETRQREIVSRCPSVVCHKERPMHQADQRLDERNDSINEVDGRYLFHLSFVLSLAPVINLIYWRNHFLLVFSVNRGFICLFLGLYFYWSTAVHRIKDEWHVLFTNDFVPKDKARFVDFI